jgi:hypothetical protein
MSKNRVYDSTGRSFALGASYMNDIEVVEIIGLDKRASSFL